MNMSIYSYIHNMNMGIYSYYEYILSRTVPGVCTFIIYNSIYPHGYVGNAR